MTVAPPDPHCRELAALLVAATDDEQAEALLRAHVATCHACTSAENALASLVRRYREAEQPPLAASLEQRLLAQLCGSPPR